jgi:hypothetical protein
VAAQLGYCGLDRQRRPLRGDEIQGCWEAAALVPEMPDAARTRPRPAIVDLDLGRTPVRRLEFVEVGAPLAEEPEHRLRRRKPETAVRATRSVDAAAPVTPVATATDLSVVPETIRPQQGSTEPRWSLWSDGEI